MFDLTRLPWQYLETLGRARFAEICGCKPNMVAMWVSRKQFPISALQKLLEHDPTPLQAIKPFYTTETPAGKLAILLPSNRKAEPHTWESVVKMYKPGEMLAPKTFNFNSIYHVRNMAAQYFLDQNVPWSWWSDDDMAHPCGNAAWFRQAIGRPNFPEVFAGVNSILRLLYHQKKMVGGAYMARRKGGEPQYGGLPPLRELMKRGPQDRLIQVPWVGFGSTLIHREVFLDIRKLHPELTVTNEQVRKRLGYDFSYFQPIENDYGDDISFCRRAVEAGHEIFVDLAVMPAHIGTHAFNYDDL